MTTDEPQASHWGSGRVSERDYFEEKIKYERELREANERSVQIALSIQGKELERRLEGLNELRQQVIEDRAELVRSETFASTTKAQDVAAAAIRDRVGALEGRFLGISLAALLLSAVALVVGLVQ